MYEIILHSVKVGALQVTSGHNPGSQRLRGAIGQFVDEVVLTGQDDGQVGFGVFFKLADGMQFSKDLQTQQ